MVADSTWIAMQARKKLKVDWDLGPHANESTESLRHDFQRVVDSRLKVVIDQGNFDAALKDVPAAKRALKPTMNCRFRHTPPWSR